jgi:hypothetical protein
MDAAQWNAVANLCVTAVLLLGSFLQMITRASDFKVSEPISTAEDVHPVVRFAEQMNDRAAMIVALGAAAAYFVAAVALFVAGGTSDALVLVLAILSAVVVLFSIVAITMLKLGKLTAPAA